MLKVNDIHTYYGQSHIIQGISLEIPKQFAVALLGRNGVGKTTFVYSINGFNSPRKGSVFFRGAEITKTPAYRISQMGISVVPQGRRVFPSLTVRENLAIAARGNKKTREDSIDKIFDMFPPLQQRAHHKGNELSGGELQMVAIGRALVADPELILLDEPSEGLAPVVVQTVMSSIVQMKKLGVAMILVEQDVDMALALVDYAYIMNRGRIVYESTAGELKTNEEIKVKWLGVGE